MLGLVLTAGGARGAYQAGVLKRLGEIPSRQGRPSPFSVITGASAGAINGSAIAAQSEDFFLATRKLAELWSTIKFQNVFKVDPVSLAMGSALWIRDLSLGGLIGGGGTQSLLDFSPLRKYLSDNLPFRGIGAAIEKRHLYAIGISATSYYSGKSFTFIQGQDQHPIWEKSRRIALSVQLDVNHIWASCAIPVIFQPVLLKTELGDFYFGDGGLRMVTPISPAIRLGATRVFAIGIRSQKAAEERSQKELLENHADKIRMKRPSLAQVLGITLNSIFLDHLDTDLDHLIRMNGFLSTFETSKGSKPHAEPIRLIQPFAIHPSVDLAGVAAQFHHKLPRFVRYLLEGLGTSRAESADLMSYLLFEPSYTQTLIDIGYRDADSRIEEVESFLEDRKT